MIIIQQQKALRDEIRARFRNDLLESSLVGGGTAVGGGGSGAAGRVAYWADADTLTSDPGLLVDAAGNGYVVADDGYVGITADVRTVYDASAGHIIETLGDAAGTDEWRVNDSAGANVANVDSDGNMFIAGHVGIGLAASASYQLVVYEAALNTAASYFGIFNYQYKNAGASDVDDNYVADYNLFTVDQVGGTIGNIYAANNAVALVAGTIGSAVADRDFIGTVGYARMTGGTIYGIVAGIYAGVEQDAGNTTNGNIYGVFVDVDADGTLSGSAYMLYLDENSNIDYGVYQNGTAPNTFGGNVTAPNHYVPDDGAVGVSGDVRAVFDSSSGFIELTLGDAAGADEVQVVDSGAAAVASIDSDGNGYFAGNVGIGAAASATYHLQVFNNALDTAATYYGMYNRHTKTAGASDQNDEFYGAKNSIVFNQVGGVFGQVVGYFSDTQMIAGTVGTAVDSRMFISAYTRADLDGGTIYGDTYGGYVVFDQEAANTINGDAYGEFISVDADGTVTGTVYMLYLNTKTNVDYGIYQLPSGAAVNYLGSKTAIGGTTSPAAQLHIDQSSSTAAIPVLLLDQADLSEEFIEFTTTVGAGNPIDTAALGAYYGKARVNVTGVGYKYIALYD